MELGEPCHCARRCPLRRIRRRCGPAPHVQGVVVVPQQFAWVVERFGKFHSVLEPGLNFLVPGMHRIRYVYSLKEEALSVPSQVPRRPPRAATVAQGTPRGTPTAAASRAECRWPPTECCRAQTAITRDNVNISIDGVLYVKVVDAYKAAYGVDDPHYAITQLARAPLSHASTGTDTRADETRADDPPRATGDANACERLHSHAETTMRSEIGKLTLDKTFEERDNLNASIVATINAASDDWGIACMRYEIRDINPPASVRTAMEMQAEAERRKRALVLDSEGERDAEVRTAPRGDAPPRWLRAVLDCACPVRHSPGGGWVGVREGGGAGLCVLAMPCAHALLCRAHVRLGFGRAAADQCR